MRNKSRRKLVRRCTKWRVGCWSADIGEWGHRRPMGRAADGVGPPLPRRGVIGMRPAVRAVVAGGPGGRGGGCLPIRRPPCNLSPTFFPATGSRSFSQAAKKASPLRREEVGRGIRGGEGVIISRYITRCTRATFAGDSVRSRSAYMRSVGSEATAWDITEPYVQTRGSSRRLIAQWLHMRCRVGNFLCLRGKGRRSVA